MQQEPESGPATVESYLEEQAEKDLLRFITCGSVDDGKSTLIGRMLYDSKLIFDDQLATLTADSKRVGTQGDALDLALLVDGLQAEREQGITIDVAHRFFATDKRKFIVADTPGHEQYTRNMATGASTAELAVILIDARKGVLTQTRRHSFIVKLLGIRHVVVAVNKMDLMDYDQAVFDDIVADYSAFAEEIGLGQVTSIPLSALTGENVRKRGENMAWYSGDCLLDYLEKVDCLAEQADDAFRFPVQWVNRSSHDFRGFAGTIASGSVATGQEVVIQPSGKTSRVSRIVTYGGDLERAIAGQSVTLTMEDEVDISRGDVITTGEDSVEVTDQLQAHIIWMHEDAMLPERPYLIKLGARTIGGAITDLKYKINVNNLDHLADKTLALNEVGVCNIHLDSPISYTAYGVNHELGGFIIIDRLNNTTVGAGMIDFGLRRATNLVWHDMAISREARAKQKKQQPCVLWFTGLSGSGKSTVADQVDRKLHALGKHVFVLDGDNVRHGLNKDLGFTDADRVENIRRVAEVAKILADSGMIVLVSFISPFRAERRMARALMLEDEFFEVFIDAPLAVCEERDPKGLYEKARAGDIANFTGISSPYEPPELAEVHIDTTQLPPQAAADQIIQALTDMGKL